MIVEHICRTDERVIEQCELSGIPRSDMHKVYCDPWIIGYDERWGNKQRVQQALLYYRPDIDDCQYQYPLDFFPIFDAVTKTIIDMDIPKLRRPVSKAPPVNYHPEAVEKNGGYRADLKPIHVTQPEGVSFTMNGREIQWQSWSMHIVSDRCPSNSKLAVAKSLQGFNYRDGIVLNNIVYNDKGTKRDIFYRLSLSEMVVP